MAQTPPDVTSSGAPAYGVPNMPDPAGAPLKPKKKFPVVWVIVAVVLVAVLTAGGVFVVKRTVARQEVEKQLDLGNKYMDGLEYPDEINEEYGELQAASGGGQTDDDVADGTRLQEEERLAAETEARRAEENAGRNGQAMTVEEVLSANVGDIVTFGAYEQDNDLENGKEPIEWYVLDKADGEVTLFSVYLLDNKQYNEEFDDITWEDCSLRAWLNGEFYDMAFNETEASAIRQTNVVNDANPFYDTPGGSNTSDKVWLLSLGELEKYFGIPMTQETNPLYNGSLSSYVGQYFEYPLYCYRQDSRILAKSTAYAQAKGVEVMTREDAASWREGYDFSHAVGCGWWWLRSSGFRSDYVADVRLDGYVDCDGDVPEDSQKGVRPALKLGY